MALSQQDLDALDTALASGELTIRTSGREVTYRSVDDLLKARAAVAAALATAASPSRPAGPRHLLASFAD